jgi:hypothetical protein
MGRQAVEKAIESLHERKSDSFELLSVKAVIIKWLTFMYFFLTNTLSIMYNPDAL